MGPNTGFHLTAAPVALWAAGGSLAQPQVNPRRIIVTITDFVPQEHPELHSQMMQAEGEVHMGAGSYQDGNYSAEFMLKEYDRIHTLWVDYH